MATACSAAVGSRQNRLNAWSNTSWCSWRWIIAVRRAVRATVRLPRSTRDNACCAAIVSAGPTGSPVRRSSRAKCMTFAARVPIRPTRLYSFRRLLRFSHQSGCFGAANLRDIILVFQQNTQRLIDRLWRELRLVQVGQRLRPVDRLSHPGQLEQVLATQPLHEFDHLRREMRRHAWRLGGENGAFADGVRIVHPMIQAAPSD